MSMFSIASSKRDAGPGDGGLERVQVDDDQVDRLDALGLERGEVVGDVAAGEDAAVELGMERLDPAAEDLGLAGVGRDLGDVQPGLAARAVRVPPLASRWTPAAARARASSISPRLSETLSNARRIGTMLAHGSMEVHPAPSEASSSPTGTDKETDPHGIERPPSISPTPAGSGGPAESDLGARRVAGHR